MCSVEMKIYEIMKYRCSVKSGVKYLIQIRNGLLALGNYLIFNIAFSCISNILIFEPFSLYNLKDIHIEELRNNELPCF